MEADLCFQTVLLMRREVGKKEVEIIWNALHNTLVDVAFQRVQKTRNAPTMICPCRLQLFLKCFTCGSKLWWYSNRYCRSNQIVCLPRAKTKPISEPGHRYWKRMKRKRRQEPGRWKMIKFFWPCIFWCYKAIVSSIQIDFFYGICDEKSGLNKLCFQRRR